MTVLEVLMKKLSKDLKILGYALLIVGICLMVYSVVSALSILTGSDVPIEILKTVDSPNNTQGTIGENGASNIDFSQMISPMFPVFNAMIFLTIAFFILWAGQKFARLGLNILKPTPAPIIKTAVINKEPTNQINKKL
jgi:hypothetical protein